MSRKHGAIAAALLMALVGAAIDTWSRLHALHTQLLTFWLPNISILACVFFWLHYDSVEHGYRRSPLLNVGIVALGVIFIPWYLFKSRQRGTRLRAILYFFGLLLALLGVALAGAWTTGVAHFLLS